MIPQNYPNYKLLHYYFTIWNKNKIFEKALKKILTDARKSQGKQAKTSFIIVASQSVKNTDSATKKATMLIKKFLCYGGYSGEKFANKIKEICGSEVEIAKS